VVAELPVAQPPAQPSAGPLPVARLLVSLSGLTDENPEPLARAVEFTAEMAARGVMLSQLLRPRSGPEPLRADGALVRWMHERRGAGDAVGLHGYDHTADPIGSWHSSTIARVGRRAEFAGLPRHEAGLRLTAARRALTAVGLRTELFVPPRWLASPGTVEALREQGFRVLADEHGVRHLQEPGLPFVRARVLGFRASGERHPLGDDRRAVEAWRCRTLVAEVTRMARRGGLVRINVRSKDLRREHRRDAVLAAVDAALELGAVPATYRSTPVARAA
jgi:predicted deacetylase